jgi:hypothetical protein
MEGEHGFVVYDTEDGGVVYTLFEVLKRAAICSGSPRSTW